MPEQENTSKFPKQRIILIISILLVAICAVAAVAVVLLGEQTEQPTEPTLEQTQSSSSTAPTTQPTETTVPPTTTEPTEPPVEKIASVTISNMGDILMHGPVRVSFITKGYQDGDKWVEYEHDFSPIFQHIAHYISQSDYAVVNLETPLAGLENGRVYSGAIGSFNAPDVILDGASGAGFDMFLTSNNHTYDCGSYGMHRTMEVIRDKNLAYLGTQMNEEEPDYKIVELSGIRIGMACYTYEVPNADPNHKSLNGKWVTAADKPLVSSFDYYWLDTFYAQVEADIAAMKTAGVDQIILYTHWGDEYKLVNNATQKQIAQKLCDLGVDVIVGGHPHVVQPVELLTSTTDPEHATVCLYSMGNAISNQRRQLMRLKTGHTEDGLIFNLTFSKYSDGTVILENADIIPTWVNNNFQILPADGSLNPPAVPETPTEPSTEATEPSTEVTQTPTEPATEPTVKAKPSYTPPDWELLELQASQKRTMAIVGTGLEAVQTYLQANTAKVEAEIGVTG